jgi:hypothetical protein
MSLFERTWLYSVLILAPLSCLVGGVITDPPLPKYIGLAALGVFAALIPACVAGAFETLKIYSYPDQGDRLDRASK